MKLICCVALLTGTCRGQSIADLQGLTVPQAIDLSPDGSTLWYRLSDDWWKIATTIGAHPTRVVDHSVSSPPKDVQLRGTPRLSNVLRSPDGKRIAYLDAQTPLGPLLLFCRSADDRPNDAALQPLSQVPVLSFQWAADSKSFWIIGVDGADEPLERMQLDGTLHNVNQTAALRSIVALAAGNDVVAWVQSDGAHHGTIWVRDTHGNSRMLVDPNPQTAAWSTGWTQEVVKWTNSHGEELQGILATPKGGGPFPLIVDPYSARRNRFLNTSALGNYAFVKAGFAVFQPDHRAPYCLPESAFGKAYVGSSRERDPVDVVTEDVMSGVDEVVRRKIADPKQMFLYSASNGASAIDQLLTQTHAFVAAVSYGGVANWLGYYQLRHPLGDETIPEFLGGRTPQTDPALYRRISALNQADAITTPLLLVIGDKDTRYSDTMEFYKKLRELRRPVYLTVYQGEEHELSSVAREQAHVQKALDFFRSVQAGQTPVQ